jgi:hypothetical protein
MGRLPVGLPYAPSTLVDNALQGSLAIVEYRAYSTARICSEIDVL